MEYSFSIFKHFLTVLESDILANVVLSASSIYNSKHTGPLILCCVIIHLQTNDSESIIKTIS